MLSLSIGVETYKASLLETYSHFQADFKLQSFWQPEFLTGAGRCFDKSGYVGMPCNNGQQTIGIMASLIIIGYFQPCTCRGQVDPSAAHSRLWHTCDSDHSLWEAPTKSPVTGKSSLLNHLPTQESSRN